MTSHENDRKKIRALRIEATSYAFASRAEPLQQAFIDGHLPADFIIQSKAAVKGLG
jgi:hypothetical protein